MQNLIFKSTMPQTTKQQLTFSVPDIDVLFPGFQTGDFAIAYGSQSVTSFVSKLCVLAQLPQHLGGLDSKVVFIDAANSSSLHDILQAAEIQQIDVQAVMGRLLNSRAYTAYRLTSLIMNQLEQTVKASGAKLVVISDIACPFLNENVDDQEARAAYNQIINYLSNFARTHGIIIIATYLPHESRRNDTLQEITSAKAGIVLRFSRTPYTSEVELEKHPSYMLGVADFSEENYTLPNY
jgi:apolipoprotein N-acyltransferase